MYIQEQLTTPIAGEYEVAICGGGFAGISAALAAARQGKKTVLFEKQYMLGGLGTAGLVTIFLPLCDGFGRQVSYGIAEELFRLSILHGAEDKYPANWLTEGGSRTENDPRFEVQYNPQLFAIQAEKLLLDTGVEIYYGTSIVAATVDNKKITHLVTDNKSGRQAWRVGTVVDATGDCDIAHFVDAPTKNFQQGNILAAWYYSIGAEGYRLHSLGFCDIPDEDKVKKDQVPQLVNRRFGGLEGKELSDMICLSHQSVYQDFLKHRRKDGGMLPVTMATTPQIRMTRRLDGETEMSVHQAHTYCADSVGMVSNWKQRGPVYEVPFTALYSRSVKNLITAGRCVSAEESMWDVMRVIPCCCITGQAAGTAAALFEDFSIADIEKLQSALKAAGVKLHESDI